MSNSLGYTKPLFILPFDHRSSFIKAMLGIKNQELTREEIKQVIGEKEIIYEAFKLAISNGISKDEASILVDEQFGDKILRDAKKNGLTTILTTEKSGQKEFTFEYGDSFGEHIKKYKPTFAKALIHYNPEDEKQSKIHQQKNLKILSDYCHNNNYKFLLEVLVKATSKELKEENQDKEKYDKEMRPRLEVKVIEELQNANIEPDVWKLEGMETVENYHAAVSQIQKNGRNNVGLVVLGRGADYKQVEQWISIGAKVKGVIGFAVGRTVFWQPLVDLKNGKISRDQTIEEIANNFKYFYDIFIKGQIKI